MIERRAQRRHVLAAVRLVGIPRLLLERVSLQVVQLLAIPSAEELQSIGYGTRQRGSEQLKGVFDPQSPCGLNDLIIDHLDGRVGLRKSEPLRLALPPK